jgi:hypothetical protein
VLSELQLDWKQVHRVNSLSTENVTSHQHKPLFAGDLGTLKGHKVHIAVEPDARPKFSKARPVPFAYKAKVEAELKRWKVMVCWNGSHFQNGHPPLYPYLNNREKSEFVGTIKVQSTL